ncbi:Carboxylesterase [Sphingobium chlorophenolicum L-1]|uniref:Carboxylic ester hydrolase n=1 Tax=Sphingobium chlorophenolicum L-1 TaxID=690566 RepID=F6F3C4_SPHCR|nr:carboxylesterase family protein [Sphingobium chlorophenolicum]AEG50936.1 Carboxylesterase [Sphingobium chlorophenolicum L-1]
MGEPIIMVFDYIYFRKSAKIFTRGTVALASLFGCGLAIANSGHDEKPHVTIAAGRLQGVTEDGVTSFKGIPFAAPPVGALRWRAPQPVPAWSGVRDASNYGNDCMQLPVANDAAPLGMPPAEDCLYLNVWKPAGEQRPLPVLVWIYGGGFLNGGASPPTYSGAALAKRGIMMVSFNYRIGRFGTFAHPLLTKSDEDNGLVGNYGFMDQIAALKWVQGNIAKFGGDPANVTIIGESAGGMSVNTLLTSPMAKGLFTRAVIQSGGDGSTMEAQGSLSQAEEIGVAFARSKGIAETDPKALEKLRALPAEEVLDGLNMLALFQSGPRNFSSPFPDGKIAIDIRQAYKSGNFSHVPVMIGATSDDIGGKTGYMAVGARRIARMISDQGVPVFFYRFSYVADSVRAADTKGAAHASEIPYFFDNVAIRYGDRTMVRDVALGDKASAYLVNFVRTGDPNGPGLPQWQPFRSANDAMMDFSAEGRAVAGADPLASELDVAMTSP